MKIRERLDNWVSERKRAEAEVTLESSINTIISRVKAFPYTKQVETIKRITSSLEQREKELLKEAEEVRESINSLNI